MWAVDLDLYLTDKTMTFELSRFLTDSTFDLQKGQLLTDEGAPRSFISSGLIRHPKLSAIPHGHFFQLCREENFIFDIESFQGPIFSLVDTLLKGVIGVTCVSGTSAGAASYLVRIMLFLDREIKALQGDQRVTTLESNVGSVRRIAEAVLATYEEIQELLHDGGDLVDQAAYPEEEREGEHDLLGVVEMESHQEGQEIDTVAEGHLNVAEPHDE